MENLEQNQPTGEKAVPEPKPKSSPLFMILLSLLMFVLGGASVFAYFTFLKPEKVVPKPVVPPTSSPTSEASPAPTPSVEEQKPTEELPTETLRYQPNSSWSTFTDNVAGYSIQYPKGYKLGDGIREGENVYFLNCTAKDPRTGGELCLSGFGLQIYYDFNQGSRRTWLNQKFPVYKPYYQNYIIDGKKALVAIEGNPGGSSALFIAIPNGSTMVVYTKTFVAWDPDTGKLPDLTYDKQILQTFKFTE